MRGVAHWRAADVDVATCRRGGVAVAGVDEDGIDLYRYLADGGRLGPAAAGRRGRRRRRCWWPATDPRTRKVARGLAQAGARVLVAAPDGAGRISLYGGEKVGDAPRRTRPLAAASPRPTPWCCAPPTRTRAPSGPAAGSTRPPWRRPRRTSPWSSLSGELDGRGLAGAGLRSWPGAGDPAPLELLPQPLIELHTAGLKVGEVMARARRRGSSPLAAEQLAAAEAHAELLPKDLGAPRR